MNNQLIVNTEQVLTPEQDSQTLANVVVNPNTVGNIIEVTDPSASGGQGLNLADAIASASSGDTITFANSLIDQTIQHNGYLTIDTSITIDGDITGDNKADITIEGQSGTSIFTISRDTNVALEALTLSNGNANKGGAIYNEGNLTINNTTISGNRAYTDGGGIYNASSGDMRIRNSTISNNMAPYDGGQGGGIFNLGTLFIFNSTISGNLAGEGAGLYNNYSAQIWNSTVTGNTAFNNGGGGIYQGKDATILNLVSTIVSGNINSGENLDNDIKISSEHQGSQLSGGTNLIGRLLLSGADISDDFFDFNIIDTNPELAPLADNGGPTLTHGILPGSPAIDSGSNSEYLTTDQRGEGFPRDKGTRTDIGAFESDFVNLPPEITINNGLALDEDTSQAITNQNLALSDPDNPNSEIFLILSTLPQSGILTLNGTRLAVGDIFSQADIDSGFLSYTHDGRETTSDRFTFYWRNTITTAASFDITVNPINDAPIVNNPIPNQWVEANTTYNYTLPTDLFSDGEGDELSISVNNLPEWLNYNNSTPGILSGNIPNSQANYTLEIVANDGNNGITTDTFSLFITQPTPVIGNSQQVIGNNANNQITTENGNNFVNANGGNDLVEGGSDRDILFGGDGDDNINGGDGNDAIRGNSGNDLLDGKAGNDSILGGDGNDILIGGVGSNNISGNSGSDIFVLTQGEGSDLITDFSPNIDYFGLNSPIGYSSLNFVAQANNTLIYYQTDLLATIINQTPTAINNPNNFVNYQP